MRSFLFAVAALARAPPQPPMDLCRSLVGRQGLNSTDCVAQCNGALNDCKSVNPKDFASCTFNALPGGCQPPHFITATSEAQEVGVPTAAPIQRGAAAAGGANKKKSSWKTPVVAGAGITAVAALGAAAYGLVRRNSEHTVGESYLEEQSSLANLDEGDNYYNDKGELVDAEGNRIED